MKKTFGLIEEEEEEEEEEVLASWIEQRSKPTGQKSRRTRTRR